MGLVDILLITLISGVVCVALPKLIYLIFSHQTNHHKSVNKGLDSFAVKDNIATFPYCTNYILRENSSCKFSPHFCTQCSNH